MTRAHTIMTALLTRALDAGEVELRGTQLYQDGRPVMPQLLFVADQEPPTSTGRASGVPLASSTRRATIRTRGSRRFPRTCWSQPRKRLRTGRAWPSSGPRRLSRRGRIERERSD